MRGTRSIFISLLAIFMVIGISLGSASALDPQEWADTWFKVKVNMKAVCESDDPDIKKLFKDSGKEPAWVYIDEDNLDENEIDAFLIVKDNGGWLATPITLSILLGSLTNNDALFESEASFTAGVTDIDIFFWVRLTAKKGKLKNAKLQSVAALLNVLEPEGECYGDFTLFGNYRKKAPPAVEQAKDDAAVAAIP